MQRAAIPIALLLVGLVPHAALGVGFDFEFEPGANQADFKNVAEDIAAAVNAKSLAPAEPTGIAGFSIGLFGSYVETEDPRAWGRLIGEEVDEIGLVGAIAQKGLPLGIDVGASYAWVPGADARLIAAELRYALIEGGITLPALGLRASYSSLSGLDALDYDGYGLDLSVSKGFGPVTPYAGAGYVWGRFQPHADSGLDDEDIDEPRLFVGLRLSALIGITPEYERVGDRDAFNLRFGLAF